MFNWLKSLFKREQTVNIVNNYYSQDHQAFTKPAPRPHVPGTNKYGKKKEAVAPSSRANTNTASSSYVGDGIHSYPVRVGCGTIHSAPAAPDPSPAYSGGGGDFGGAGASGNSCASASSCSSGSSCGGGGGD